MGRKTFKAFEIMEINAQVCYTTTQVFYLCRPIILEFPTQYKGLKGWKGLEKDKLPQIDFGMKYDILQVSWVKLREDEIKNCPKEIIKHIK